jgi:cytochrome c biogenesis protein CcmG/thiol:disulfide interchange protein DsbE
METSQTSAVEEKKQGSLRAWWAAAAVAVVVLALLAYSIATGPSAPPQVGEPVPDFQLTTLDGQEISLSSLQGNVTVLNFFASWCVPCREEAPDLEETWQAYQDQGVQFVGIAYKDAKSRAQAFLAEFGTTYPSAVDPANRTARAYGVTGVPETFIIDRQGRLVRHILGAVSRAELSLEIERASQR